MRLFRPRVEHMVGHSRFDRDQPDAVGDHIVQFASYAQALLGHGPSRVTRGEQATLTHRSARGPHRAEHGQREQRLLHCRRPAARRAGHGQQQCHDNRHDRDSQVGTQRPRRSSSATI